MFSMGNIDAAQLVLNGPQRGVEMHFGLAEGGISVDWRGGSDRIDTRDTRLLLASKGKEIVYSFCIADD